MARHMAVVLAAFALSTGSLEAQYSISATAVIVDAFPEPGNVQLGISGSELRALPVPQAGVETRVFTASRLSTVSAADAPGGMTAVSTVNAIVGGTATLSLPAFQRSDPTVADDPALVRRLVVTRVYSSNS